MARRPRPSPSARPGRRPRAARGRSVAAPRLTALRRAGPGRVALELDGQPWRTVPDDVVVRAGLGTGMALERPVLRTLRRELQRAGGSGGGRALARRDLSAQEVARRLDPRRGGRAHRSDVGDAARRRGARRPPRCATRAETPLRGAGCGRRGDQENSRRRGWTRARRGHSLVSSRRRSEPAGPRGARPTREAPAASPRAASRPETVDGSASAPGAD